MVGYFLLSDLILLQVEIIAQWNCKLIRQLHWRVSSSIGAILSFWATLWNSDQTLAYAADNILITGVSNTSRVNITK